MHTTRASDDCTFVHHGDMQGEVRIVVPSDALDSEVVQGAVQIIVDADDLLAFAAEYVRRERQSAMDSMSNRDLLRGWTAP